MGEIDERLERGVAIFRRAGDDPALLGAALLAFQGALERFLDTELLGWPALGAAERGQLEQGRLGWLARADMAERASLLGPEQRAQALAAARARTLLARGDACDWAAAELQSFGQLAALVCGRHELIHQVDQRAERARATAAHAPPVWQPPPPRRFGLLRFTAAALFLATFALVGWVLFQQIDGVRLLGALGALPAPTAEPALFDAEPSPTPPQRRAAIRGLGGGPGWLHVTPSFDSPTRAIRLADGMIVTLREQQQVDAGGVRWQQVEAGGYEGWCPEANLAILP